MRENTGDLLMAVARHFRHGYARAIAGHDLSPGQARALRVIDTTGPARLSAVAERLRIAPRSATEVVDALEDRGLVVRLPDPADRRATLVELTEDGRGLLRVVAAARTTASRELLRGLDPVDRAELDRILRLLAADDTRHGERRPGHRGHAQ